MLSSFFFPRPPQVSLFRYHADENRRVEPAKASFRIILGDGREDNETFRYRIYSVWYLPLFEYSRLAQSSEG